MASPLEEEERIQRDGTRKVLPSRNLSEVSRSQVSRNPSSSDAVDKVLPTVDGTAIPNSLSPAKPLVAKSVKAKPKLFPGRSRAPPVSIVGPHAFAMACNQPGVQLFTMSFSEAMELASTQVDTTSPDSDLSTIPSEYHEFADLFSNKEAEKLPPHRPYDHRIPLESGTTPPFGTIYFMSPTELETLRKYIDENLRKGFLRHSQSPCGAPILFVKKPDGTL
jgi:hypothetical protein